MSEKKLNVLEKPRVLLCKDAKGEFKVTIPSDARLTFGPNVPYAKGQQVNYSQGYALRIYRGPKKSEDLMAVFSSVEWFREETLDVSRLVVREAGKAVWKSNEKGYSVQEAVHRDETWVAKLTAGDAPDTETDDSFMKFDKEDF